MTTFDTLGRYRLLGEIGRGAMGIVYKAEDASLGRVIAIKTVLAGFDSGAGYYARFRQEAKALAGLNHPAIITLYDFGEQDGVAYMAMEFLEGRELKQVLAQSRLPIADAVDIAAQVAEGLEFAHDRGIVHRDIKPGNIMVLDGNRVKIMDFGLVRMRVSDFKTQTGMVLGSPRYMSPEQILSREIDHRTDIYSLGAVLYEMLTGTEPFPGSDIATILFNVCNSAPRPPSEVNPEVPAALDRIVGKAMAKDTEARYASAADLARDLRAFLAGTAPSVELTEAPTPESPPESPAPAAPASAEPIGFAVSQRFDSRRGIERLSRGRRLDPARSNETRPAIDRVTVTRVATAVAALAVAAFVMFA